MTLKLYTVGHSTRPVEDLLRLLREHTVELLVDVRTVPQSRRNPQFAQERLRSSLNDAGIEYRHMKRLGGLRKPDKSSINTGWCNESFRGYADYMQTPEFGDAIGELMTLAADKCTAIMCAEAVPWRCHRSLIADALLVRGVEVLDILSPSSSKPHRLTSFAQVEGLRITYPPAQPQLPL